MNIKYFVFFMFIFIVNTNALIDSQVPLANDILNIYGFGNSDPCSYNIFKCYNSDIGQVIFEINLDNFPSGKTYSITDLSAFSSSLQSLKINTGSVTIADDGFWNIINLFTQLQNVIVVNQPTSIQSTTFPPSLNEIIIENYGGVVNDVFFNSNLETLIINDTLSGYSISTTQFPSNNKLKNLYLVATSSIPTGFSNIASLESFGLKIDNSQPVFTIPDEFNSLSNLVYLSFFFTSDNAVFTFPSSIQNVPSMKSLLISGNGFVAPSSSGYDFTKNSNIRFDLNNLKDFLSCTQKPCIKTNSNSRLNTIDSSYSTSNIDFTNFVSVIISGNTVSQSIPEFNYDNINYLSITDNQFTGSLSDSLCGIPYNKLINFKFTNNKLSSAPSCLICTSYNRDLSSVLSGNTFAFGDSTTQCVNEFTVKGKTVGNTETIKGSALGFLTNTSTYNGPSIPPILTFTQINSEISVQILPGEGSKLIFGYDLNGIDMELTVEYEAPVISSYDFSSESLTLKGTGFSIVNNNIVTISNSENVTIKFNTTSFDGYNLILPRDEVEEIIVNKNKEYFSVNVQVSDQISQNFTIDDPDFPSNSSVLLPSSIILILLILSVLF